MSHNYIELPTLEEVNKMDQQRQQAIESLEISKGLVKCQGKCGSLQPLRPPMTGSNSRQYSSKIYQLQSRIKQIERHHIGGTSSKKEHEELNDLIIEHDKRDLLRRIPLYSSKITGYKFFCSTCYDSACLLFEEAERKERRSTNLS